MSSLPRFLSHEIAERREAVARIFVEHPDLREIQNDLDHRLRHGPVRSAVKLALLVGESGCGKTTLIRDFVARKNRAGGPRVLYALLPVPCTIKGTTSELLRRLGDPLCDRTSTTSRNTARIVHQLHEQDIRLLIIDETQHLIDHDRDKILRQTTDWIKTLLDEARTPVLCVGLPNSLDVIKSNKQLERRTNKVI